MPELPDLVVYIEALAERIQGRVLGRVRLASPFVLRSVDPPIEKSQGKKVKAIRRIGKRIVLELESDLFLVFHLMIAGRFRWKTAGAPIPKRLGLAALDFPEGTLLLTEASKKKRAAIHLVRGEGELAQFRRGGVEPLEVDASTFAQALQRENHTLKRALTDPRILSGIGNAYSDEILHRARLSPFRQSQQLTDEEIERLRDAVCGTLESWIEKLREERGEAFPERVTAFREGMAVHGRHRKPCPDCGTPVQRIVYAENDSNYCPKCQTGGKLLADRALSRLLRKDWPKTVEELEERLGRGSE
jgi:formamidopyrimidine-DNA glycosylase